MTTLIENIGSRVKEEEKISIDEKVIRSFFFPIRTKPEISNRRRKEERREGRRRRKKEKAITRKKILIDVMRTVTSKSDERTR